MNTNGTDPFGTGIICPFRRDNKNDFANASGLDLLKSDIAELLGLIGPSATQPGELPWDTERGTRLLTLKHRHIHSEMVRADAAQMSSGVLRKYEPRVQVGPTNITVREDNVLMVSVSYYPLGYSAERQTVDISPQD